MGGPLGGLGFLLASVEEARISTNATAQSFMFECQMTEDKLACFIVLITITGLIIFAIAVITRH